MTKLLMIHPEKCTGCENCVLACSFHHEKTSVRLQLASMFYVGERRISVPMMCQQCGDAPVSRCAQQAPCTARQAPVLWIGTRKNASAAGCVRKHVLLVMLFTMFNQ